MKLRWRERSGLRETDRRRFVCEVRRSQKREGVQRKLTLAHLGTVHTGADGAPSREEAARFWKLATRKLRAMRLGKATQERLIRSVSRRFPRPRAL